MSNQDLLEMLLVEFVRVFEPLAQAAEIEPVPTGIFLMGEEIGLDLNALLVDPTVLNDFATSIATGYGALKPIAETGAVEDVEQVRVLIESLRGLFTALDDLNDLQVRPEADVSGLGRKLLDYLLIRYLRSYRRAVYSFLLLGGVVTEADPKQKKFAEVDFTYLPRLFQRPTETVAGIYGWDTQDFDAYTFLSRLQKVLVYLS